MTPAKIFDIWKQTYLAVKNWLLDTTYVMTFDNLFWLILVEPNPLAFQNILTWLKEI